MYLNVYVYVNVCIGMYIDKCMKWLRQSRNKDTRGVHQWEGRAHRITTSSRPHFRLNMIQDYASMYIDTLIYIVKRT